MELKTDDGFVLDPEDILQDVLAPGSTVVPVDSDTWLKAQEESAPFFSSSCSHH